MAAIDPRNMILCQQMINRTLKYSYYVTNQQVHINKIYIILSYITVDRLRVLSDLQYDTHLYLINRLSISCIHSLSIPSDDRFKASSKTIPPHSAI